ncbi:hypothetical protein [Salinispora sp. H7-4]|uniref:hypothetical protein n=1 Tax=Salinispora sp. H7-4 TaxID=2748321 RepID=UPI0015D36E85|nr:hypothetical protein [Salinispora sp. H7-4]NYT95736.1 hypothetical protein [Salinispora sp. H7-4]
MTDDQASKRTWQDRIAARHYADLAELLEQADVSERVRAAVTQALTDSITSTAYVDALVARYATERERRSASVIPPACVADAHRRWTLHLTYRADDLPAARDQAVIYVEGLTLLRPELSANTVLLSRADAWNQVEPLFCGQLGPDREVCADTLGHAGFHQAAGLGGFRWGDGDDGCGR